MHLPCVVACLYGAAVLGGAIPCATDADCPFDGPFRCCGTNAKSENCPISNRFFFDANGNAQTNNTNCALPGRNGASHCDCKPIECDAPRYLPAAPGMKQWLMIGDSISNGVLSMLHEQDSGEHIKYTNANKLHKAGTNVTSHGIQVSHNPTNAANVWWGAHCLDKWLTSDPGRWDVITFQFGLHDLALDNERLEPDTLYTHYLTNITQRIADAAPKAKLVWVTTTPVPLGIGGHCNKTTRQGGCPPRRVTDPAIYNAAAAKAVAAAPAASRIEVLDLYSVVTKKCGVAYNRCPEGCTATKQPHGGGWEGNCYQIPLNVHYLPAGWTDLAGAYVNAVVNALES